MSSQIATLAARLRAGVNLRRLSLALAAALLGLGCLLWPAIAWQAGLFALDSLLGIAPMILVAVFLVAFAAASGAVSLIARSFSGRQGRMIVLASLVGALTPVCGVTVYPLIAGLLAARVPLAPIMAFLLASPITGPGMLAVTAGTLGLPFAIGKSLAAILCGLIGGAVILISVRAGLFAVPARVNRLTGDLSGSCAPCTALLWRFWGEPQRRHLFAATLLDSGRMVLFWLLLAFVAEYFLRSYLPERWLTQAVGGGSWYAIPLATLVGMPIYLDGYAALPLIRGLIDAGMQPGAALSFLVAGGIVSAWSAIPAFSLLRLPVFITYIGLAFIGALLSGFCYALVL
ncbi:MAG: permease [Rhodospirillales bacterium]|nr:permease [Rhodospirillales bacterium]